MSSPIIRKVAAVFAVVTVAAALSSSPAVAKGPSPKASLTASSSCLLTATVSWKNLTVTEVVWSLNENGTMVAGGFNSGFGSLSSPQSTGFQRTPSATANSFSVTAQLLDGATQVGTATSRARSVSCS